MTAQACVVHPYERCCAAGSTVRAGEGAVRVGVGRAGVVVDRGVAALGVVVCGVVVRGLDVADAQGSISQEEVERRLGKWLTE